MPTLCRQNWLERTEGATGGGREEGERTDERTDGRTNKRSSAGVCNGALLGKMPDKLRPPSGAFTPTFPWSLPLRQLFFEHGARPDAARKRITRANCQRGAQLPDEKPKINSPRGLPLSALISHACSTERGIAGAVGRERYLRLPPPMVSLWLGQSVSAGW